MAKKIFKTLDLIVISIMVICSIMFTSLALAQVFFRFVLNSSLTWSEELCRYLFAELVFFGVGICVLEKRLANIDIIVKKMPEKAKKYYQCFLDFITVITGIMLTFTSVQFALNAIGQTSPALQIPYEYIYTGMVIGSAVLTISGMRNIYTTLTQKSTYYSYISKQWIV